MQPLLLFGAGAAGIPGSFFCLIILFYFIFLNFSIFLIISLRFHWFLDFQLLFLWFSLGGGGARSLQNLTSIACWGFGGSKCNPYCFLEPRRPEIPGSFFILFYLFIFRFLNYFIAFSSCLVVCCLVVCLVGWAVGSWAGWLAGWLTGRMGGLILNFSGS